MAEVYQVVSKDNLKKAVDTQLEGLTPNNEIVIVGARLIKDGRLELEFAQFRTLKSRAKSALSVINKGDKRFDINKPKVYRVWNMVTVEGATEAFGIDFQPIADQAANLKPDERLVIMIAVKQIAVDGELYDINISVKETTSIKKLPKSAQEDIKNNSQYADRYELRFPNDNGELENVVDSETGDIVYRWNELEYLVPGQTIDDMLVDNKTSASQYIEDVTGNVSQSINIMDKLKMKSPSAESKAAKMELNI